MEGRAGMRCITLIPIYKETLDANEEACVLRYQRVLGNADVFFLAPQKMNTNWYQSHFPQIQYRFFQKRYFTGVKSYNHLMLSPAFYRSFEEYDYMLIAQTDAVIWQNENLLDQFMERGYDYIGAPWIPERRIWEWVLRKKSGFPGWTIQCCKKEGQGITMGNGGFCLRNIKKCEALIKENAWRKCYWFWKRNEDIFFGVFGRENKSDFQLADVTTGLLFAREYHLKESIDKGEIPFGVHGWLKEFKDYEEMEQYLSSHGAAMK
ncbi:MAG TPA: DUF5672 family protein [Lachnospiraceae bacterium]|nr:DUF5672 family protein [Lachnospiraceae bacterium]